MIGARSKMCLFSLAGLGLNISFNIRMGIAQPTSLNAVECVTPEEMHTGKEQDTRGVTC